MTAAVATSRHGPPPDPALPDAAWCAAMLPRVSRTFAACIRLLPPPLLHQVLIAYLLCRIADTVEDAPDLPAVEKRRLLATFRDALAEGGGGTDELARAFATVPGDDPLLAREAARTLGEFRAQPAEVRAAIRPWVQEMCDGMAGFASLQSTPGAFQTLDGEADLDRYCWYVAGTVGHLLTALFAIHSRRIAGARLRRLEARATDFGLGLQLVNIIKDVADDRGRGWSFVPRQLCAGAGFAPEELLRPERAAAARAVMERLIRKAAGHLEGALEYCTLLPAAEYRIRLFCLAPLNFAVRTLAAARRDPRLLDPGHKVKITRGEVYRILAAGFVVAPSDGLIRAYYRRLEAAG